MNAKTTHQIVIKPQRHKKLARPILKIWLGMALSIVFWVSNQRYTPISPKIIVDLLSQRDVIYQLSKLHKYLNYLFLQNGL